MKIYIIDTTSKGTWSSNKKTINSVANIVNYYEKYKFYGLKMLFLTFRL